MREIVTPHRFFEALGVRYAGPIDGHDIAGMEQALAHAAEWDGPIVVHVLTQKGRGYAPAEEDDVQRLHDFKVQPPPPASATPPSCPRPPTPTPSPVSLIRHARDRPEVVAITAAMPGPTGLLPFQAEFPDRFLDVGIAEQHAVTAAAGMAMAGLRPVVAVYSTFFSRAFDQANLDVGLHGLPGGLRPRPGRHHRRRRAEPPRRPRPGAQALPIPGMTVFAPSSAQEVGVMLDDGTLPRRPVGHPVPEDAGTRQLPTAPSGTGLAARQVHSGDGTVCLLAVGKMVEAAEEAAGKLAPTGVDATVWDVRVVSAPDPAMLADAAAHGLVVTVEDGIRRRRRRHVPRRRHAGLSARIDDRCRRWCILGVPRAYIPQGKPDQILAELGLDGPGIAAAVHATSRRSASHSAPTPPRRRPRCRPARPPPTP